MKLTKTLIVLLMGAILTTSLNLRAEETLAEKTAATATKAKNATKRGVRAAQDEVCEMINGKMECVGQKVKHKAQNAVDATGAKVKEVKNKVD